MESVATTEAQLADDVEALRLRYANTQELYREVCVVMFFRYGLTPTANRLYQLVRKGSMSAPAEALARFWAQLRERSRVTIDGPGLPEALRTGAGELVSALWKQAQEAATADLAAMREEAENQVAAATAAAGEAMAQAAALAGKLETTSAALATARDDIAALRHQLAAGEALHGQLRQRIDDARRELNEQHAWFKTVERDHAAALDKLRLQLQTERDATETRRALVAQELERERTAATRLQNALDAERETATAAAERQRGELRETLAQVAGLHQRIGALEGSASAACAARDRAFDELAQSRRELAGAQAQAAAAAGRAAALESALRHATERPEPSRPRNRSQAD